MVSEKDKYENMMEAEWKKINSLASRMIRLYLGKDQKYFVMRKIIISDFWQKFKDKCITKSIENYFY